MSSAFGINFSPLNVSALADRLSSEPVPRNEGARLVVTTNVDHVVNLTRNREFRLAYSKAWTATADGMPVYLYARLRGKIPPCRVPGPDLFAALMPKLSPKHHRPFFMVSNVATGERLKAWLQGRGFDAEAIAVESPPFGFENDVAYSRQLAARIKFHRATHLFIGVGSPKSEVWVERHRDDIGDCYAFGIGAGVDFFVGVEKRAPRWMRRIGMEWFWRFIREPKRLFRRYFLDSWIFLVAIKNDLVRTGADNS